MQHQRAVIVAALALAVGVTATGEPFGLGRGTINRCALDRRPTPSMPLLFVWGVRLLQLTTPCVAVHLLVCMCSALCTHAVRGCGAQQRGHVLVAGL